MARAKICRYEGEEMPIDRSKRTTFENVADIYDKVRTEYPQELIEDMSKVYPYVINPYTGCQHACLSIPFCLQIEKARICAIQL